MEKQISEGALAPTCTCLRAPLHVMRCRPSLW